MNSFVRFFTTSDFPGASVRPDRGALVRLLLATIVVVACSWPAARAAENVPQRAFAVDDIFELESLGGFFGGPFAFSSSGTLAFTRTRAMETIADHRWEWLLGNAASDIWLQSGYDEPINLTRGAQDGSGWWAPEWSPDGRYLAMLSTRGGTVRAWIWDTSAAKLTLAVDGAVDVHGGRPFRWLNDTLLLLSLMPEGESSSGMQVGLSTPEILVRQWEKMAVGTESTVSVLDIGTPAPSVRAPPARLVTVDVASGKEQLIFRGKLSGVSTSPSGKFIAYMRQTPGPSPTSDGVISFDNERQVMGLLTTTGSKRTLQGDQIVSVVPGEFHWSPDERALAVAGQTVEKERTVPSLYVVDPDTGSSSRVPLKMLKESDPAPRISGLQWTRTGDIVLRVSTCGGNCGPEKGGWWLISPDGGSQKLDGFPGEPPVRLWRQSGGDAFLGLSEESLVQVHPRHGIEKLGGEAGQSVVSLDWPSVDGEDGDVLPPDDSQGLEQLVFSTRNGDKQDSFTLDLSTGKIGALETPADDARLVAYDRSSRSALYLRSDESGLRLWRVWVDDGRILILIESNDHLQQIRFATAKMIQYTSLDGAALEAWLLLPPDSAKGKPVPLLTWVYAGSTVSEKLPWTARATSVTPFNLQIPVGQGFAVLIPSMPVHDENTEPMSSLANGVLPAIDKVLQHEHVDPKRVYLMGHSYGGYSTLGLITQTDRFAAAVSIAGISNLFSMYGQFDSRKRYQDQVMPDALFGMIWTEAGQGHMAAPPWKRPERYIRNSPLFHVEKVTTPVLIVQGDLDAVPLQQGEEFFTALYRTGKRAQFVRYWGEGHILSSPANIHDFWTRVFAWFDKFPPE